MSEWIDVAREGSMAEGEHIVVEVDGTAVAVFFVDGQYHAIEDICSHDGAEVASGRVEHCEIICPRHGARFCLKTGKVRKAPAYEDLATFPVRIENGQVQVRDNRWD